MYYLLKLICLIALLTSPAYAEPLGLSLAGLGVGKATWTDLARFDAKNASLQRETPLFPPNDLGVAHVTGQLFGKLHGTATLYFDSNQVLSGVVIAAPAGAAPKYLGQLARNLRAKEVGPNQFSRGDWVLSTIRTPDGNDAVQIATPAFAQKIASRTALLAARDAQQAQVFKFGAWALAALAAAGLAFVAGPSLLKRRLPLFEHSLVGSVAIGITLSLYSIDRLPTSFVDCFWPGLGLIGLWLMVLGAMRTVRASGWLPGDNFYASTALAILAMPLLTGPLVARNAIRSLPYATSVLLILTLLATAYFYWQPPPFFALQLLPIVSLLSGGAIRIASSSFSWAQRRVSPRFRLLSVPLALAISPVTALIGLAMGGIAVLGMLFSPLLVALGLGLVAVSVFDSHWIPVTLTVLLSLFMLSPILAPALMPTGISNLDFSSQSSALSMSFPTSASDFGGSDDSSPFGSFNPANGMPLLSGSGGMDIFGNSFGSNLNDPF